MKHILYFGHLGICEASGATGLFLFEISRFFISQFCGLTEVILTDIKTGFVGIKKEIDIIKVLRLYRYCSFLITSIYFVLSGETHSNTKKAFIIGCIGVSAFLLNYLYKHYLSERRVLIFLIALETILNTFILIPSGGLESPYIWYSINTIVISSVALKKKIYCWLSFVTYIISSTWLFTILLKPGDKLLNIIGKELNLLLCLALFTGAIQILSEYYKRVQEKNKELNEVNSHLISANNKIKESMDYIMELYQAVHLLSDQQDSDSLIDIILEYTRKITKSETAIFISFKKGKFNIRIKGSKVKETEIRSILAGSANEIWSIKGTRIIYAGDSSLVLSPVKSSFGTYGVLGVVPDSEVRDYELKDQMKFLTELGKIAFERNELERINKGLLINEEQNRIANEIHDGVLQKLFGISCAIYGLKKQAGSININMMKSELSGIQDSINSAMKDLRATIYGYSWKKEGKNNFVQDINSYLDFVRKNHGTYTNFELIGNQDLLPTGHKIAFYRIVSEAVSNSIRHGKAQHISVKLTIGDKNTVLEIKDDGTGFDSKILNNTKKMGMGIRNIESLAIMLKGRMKLESKPNEGTTIEIVVPAEYNSIKEDLYEGVGG